MLFKTIVGVLTTCHLQYISDRNIFLFYRTTLHFFFIRCPLCDSKNINKIIEFVPNYL